MMNHADAIETVLRRHVRNSYPSHAAMIHDLRFLAAMTYSEAVRAAKEVNRKYEAILNRRTPVVAR